MEYKRAILNFSFVTPGTLAGMSRPGARSPLAEDFAFLKAEGIGAIVSLSESPLDEAVLRESGFFYLHTPIKDFSAPTIQQVERCVEFIDRMAHVENRAVVVHCGAGCGRTGAVLACYFVRRGKSAEAAIESTRQIRPCSIETDGQRDIVYRYEEHLEHQPPAV
jgi:atypical dual specificity phosphatase